MLMLKTFPEMVITKNFNKQYYSLFKLKALDRKYCCCVISYYKF